MKVLLSVIILAVSRSHFAILYAFNVTDSPLDKHHGSRAIGSLKELKDISDELRAQIKKIHNTKREAVAAGNETKGEGGKQLPPAQNMQEMVWDHYVAKQANKLAKTCNYNHETHYDQAIQVLGQNLALKKSSESSTLDKFINSSMEEMMNNWFAEVNKFNFEVGLTTENGHFTQMIWANTWKIGCGISLCQPKEGSALFIVCDYKPIGNIIGEKPYIEGSENCARLGLNSPTKRYPHLCANRCSSIFSQQTSINNLIIYAISVYLYWL